MPPQEIGQLLVIGIPALAIWWALVAIFIRWMWREF